MASTEKHLNSQCRQCTREQEPQVDGVEERVSIGAYRGTSTVERVRKERIVLERDRAPRLEARKEEKGQRKVAMVTPEWENRTHCGKLHQRELEQECERCGSKQRRHQRGIV